MFIRFILPLFILLLTGQLGYGHQQDTTKHVLDSMSNLIKEKEDSIKGLIASADSIERSKKSRDSALAYMLADTETLVRNPWIIYQQQKKASSSVLFWRSFASIILSIFFILYSFYLMKRSELCRDESYLVINGENRLVRMDREGIPYCIIDPNQPDIRENRNYAVQKPPFSYARVQMLWWSLLILVCYTLFFGFVGVLLPLNYSAVALLGLGGIVLAAGRLIDAGEIQNSDIPMGSRSQDTYSKGFLNDVLSDKKGPSIHRWQALLFNLLFGIAFVTNFFQQWASCEYPFLEFNEWQLALLGISGGTYLFLKHGENVQPRP